MSPPVKLSHIQPTSQPAVIARNMLLVRHIILNTACHPILLKLVVILNVTTYLTERILSLAAANSCIMEYAEDYSNFCCIVICGLWKFAWGAFGSRGASRRVVMRLNECG